MGLKLVKEPIEELVERFNDNFVYLNDKFINRTDELACIQLAILTGSHVMLEGPHGVAKSLLAKSIFKMFVSDAKSKLIVFSKQLTPSTHAEEIFGPMDMKKFRNESLYEFNTSGLLPTAHFAFLDEVYRGSEALLASVMAVLNEREFYNGSRVEKCPLITAVGTCNFRTETPELEAFHDRWLFSIPVAPAKTISDRVKILMAHLDIDYSNLEIPHEIKLSDLARLREHVKKEVLPELFVEYYSKILGDYITASPETPYVSDRRFCQVYRVAQAYSLMHRFDSDFDDETGVFECMLNMEYTFCSTPEQRRLFETTASTAVATITVANKEEPEIRKIEEQAEKLIERFDESLSKKELEILKTKSSKMLDLLQNLNPTEQFSTPRNRERFTTVIEKLETLKDSLDVGHNLEPEPDDDGN